jgi:hypothetical protein
MYSKYLINGLRSLVFEWLRTVWLSNDPEFFKA